MPDILTPIESGTCYQCGKTLVRHHLGGDWYSSECPHCGIILNVKECDYCRGPVDRLVYLGTVDRHMTGGITKMFQCRECGSIGDPFLGIMIPPYEKPLRLPPRKIQWRR